MPASARQLHVSSRRCVCLDAPAVVVTSMLKAVPATMGLDFAADGHHGCRLAIQDKATRALAGDVSATHVLVVD